MRPGQGVLHDQGWNSEQGVLHEQGWNSERVKDALHSTQSRQREEVNDGIRALSKLFMAFAGPHAWWQPPLLVRRSDQLSRAGHDAAVRMQKKTVLNGDQKEIEFNEDLWEKNKPQPSFDGTDLTITEFPSPILRAPNKEITEFDDKLKQLCKEMFIVMYARGGVGVAATQVGLNQQLFVMNPKEVKDEANEIVCCNPKIIEYCQEVDVEPECCLSTRGYCCYGDICRATKLQVEYQDVDGEVQKKTLEGFEARVFQHEYDHLMGVLHIDRQNPRDRKYIQPYLDKFIEEHGPGGTVDLTPEKIASLQPSLNVSMERIKTKQTRGDFVAWNKNMKDLKEDLRPALGGKNLTKATKKKRRR